MHDSVDRAITQAYGHGVVLARCLLNIEGAPLTLPGLCFILLLYETVNSSATIQIGY